MTDSPTILLEPGTRAVRLDLIPNLIATAKRPPKANESEAEAMLRAMDIERQKADLEKAVADGKVPAIDINFNLVEGTNRCFTNQCQLLVSTLAEYAKDRGVSVEIEPTTSIEMLVRDLANRQIDANRQLWEKTGHNNDLRRDIALAFEERALLDRLKSFVATGNVIPRSPENGTPIEGIQDFGFASDLHWNISASHADFFSKCSLSVAANIPHDFASIASKTEERRQVRAEQVAARKTAERYTVLEACAALARATGWYADRWKHVMLDAIRAEALPLRNPQDYGDRLPYPVPRQITVYADEVDSIGLNRWLDSNPDWAVIFRFPEPLRKQVGAASPNSQIEPLKQKPLSRQAFYESEILRTLNELNYPPRAIPRRPNGLPGVRSEVRAKLPDLSDIVFDKAWRAALKGSIDYEK
jgi:hypothetical protein